MAEGHSEGHSSHEVIEHHEPNFKTKVMTYVEFIVVGVLLVNMLTFIGNHVVHELIVEINDFFSH